MCSSTITGSGRWLLEVLYLVYKFYPDCTWTYGDTDSLYCSHATETTKSGATGADGKSHGLRREDACEMSKEIKLIVGHILGFTPFASVGLSQVMPAHADKGIARGPVYPRMMVLKSKMCALLCPGGDLELRGVSPVRRNTPPIQTAYTRELLRIALGVRDRTDLRDQVIRMATRLSVMGSSIRGGRMGISELATRTTRSGVTALQYMGHDRKDKVLSVGRASNRTYEEMEGTVCVSEDHYLHPYYA